MCLRDDVSEFVHEKTDWFSPLCDVAIGEAVGWHEAMEWVSNLQFDNVDFALDSHKDVDSFHTCVDDNYNNEFSCIINV